MGGQNAREMPLNQEPPLNQKVPPIYNDLDDPDVGLFSNRQRFEEESTRLFAQERDAALDILELTENSHGRPEAEGLMI